MLFIQINKKRIKIDVILELICFFFFSKLDKRNIYKKINELLMKYLLVLMLFLYKGFDDQFDELNH